MKRVLLVALLAAAVAALSASCASDKKSAEACRHQVSMDLDKGLYDNVLASSCSDSMQLGAAYFGKAGFDITSVLNKFIDMQSTAAGTQGAFSSYLTSFFSTTAVTQDAQNAYIQKAISCYQTIPLYDTSGTVTANQYLDAQFNLALVQSVNGLAMMRNVVDSLGIGSFSCDDNGNSVPDGADAGACAINVSLWLNGDRADTNCSNDSSVRMLYTGVSDITLVSQPTSTWTFGGITISVIPTVASSAGCSSEYKKLYYKSNGQYLLATTLSDASCSWSDGNPWPCPSLDANGKPVDLVEAVGDALMNVTAALSTSLTGSQQDVVKSMNDLVSNACGTATPGGQTSCDTQTLSTYIQGVAAQ